MLKSEIFFKITFTLSKIMGILVIITGLYGFAFSDDSSGSLFLTSLGAGMIGYKQYLTSKTIPDKDEKKKL